MYQSWPKLNSSDSLKIQQFLSDWANWLIFIPIAISIFLFILGCVLHLINKRKKAEWLDTIKYLVFLYSCFIMFFSPLIFFTLAIMHSFHWIHGILLFLFVLLFIISYFRSILATPVKIKKKFWILILLSFIFFIAALLFNYYGTNS